MLVFGIFVFGLGLNIVSKALYLAGISDNIGDLFRVILAKLSDPFFLLSCLSTGIGALAALCVRRV